MPTHHPLPPPPVKIENSNLTLTEKLTLKADAAEMRTLTNLMIGLQALIREEKHFKISKDGVNLTQAIDERLWQVAEFMRHLGEVARIKKESEELEREKIEREREEMERVRLEKERVRLEKEREEKEESERLVREKAREKAVEKDADERKIEDETKDGMEKFGEDGMVTSPLDTSSKASNATAAGGDRETVKNPLKTGFEDFNGTSGGGDRNGSFVPISSRGIHNIETITIRSINPSNDTTTNTTNKPLTVGLVIVLIITLAAAIVAYKFHRWFKVGKRTHHTRMEEIELRELCVGKAYGGRYKNHSQYKDVLEEEEKTELV